MILQGRRSWRSRLALVLVLSLTPSALALGTPRSVAAGSYASCTGGALLSNSLSAQWQWFGTQWQVHLIGYVTPLVGVNGAQVQLVSSSGGGGNLGTPGWDGTQYYYNNWINQSALNLFYPGDTTTFHLHFFIPYLGDKDTCSLSGAYFPPPVVPTPTPTPIPLPTPVPIPTPQPIQTWTIMPGQQTWLGWTGGTPYASVQWQVSYDQASWTPLVTVTLDSTGQSKYYFAPVVTAYYRAYFPNAGQYWGALIEIIVLPAPTPQPVPTPPGPGPQPLAVQTIYTITSGQSVTVTAQGTPGSSLGLESSIDGTQWSLLVTATADSGGTASFTYLPATNLYLRITSVGTSPSVVVRGLVRELALLRPTNAGHVAVVRLGASFTFTTTMRPAGAGFPRTVATFVFYKLVSGHWTLITKRQSYTDSSGRATWPWTFKSRGSWYVRSYAEGSSLNVASTWTPVVRYDVH